MSCLACTGSGGGGSQSPPVPSIESLTASPATITEGQSSTLSWSVKNADSVSLYAGTPPLTGNSVTVTPITTTTYTLTASNTQGSVTKSATVTVLPAAAVISDFSATPGTIREGDSTTMNWATEHATSLSIDQGVGDVTGKTSITLKPAATTTYTLTANNPAGLVASKTLKVTVIPNTPAPSIQAFAANPATIDPGQGSTLSWTVSYATKLTLDNGVGVVTGTSIRVTPAATTTYTLKAENSQGAAVQATATVTVNPGGAPRIYITDAADAGRIIRTDDFAGNNWISFGSRGAGSGQFGFPWGLAVDSAGRIHVADPDNNRVTRLDDMAGGNWITLGTKGSGQGQFSAPTGIAFDSSGRIYVADFYNNRIVRMDDMTGSGWITFGVSGTGAGQFKGPSGLFIDASNRIYATDYHNHRIVRFDDMTGAGWVSFGSLGSGPGSFNEPTSVFADGSGIYVADTSNNRIVHMADMKGSDWRNLGGPSPGSGVGQFNIPRCILVYKGQIYVGDAFNARIVRMDDLSGAGWTTLGTLGTGSGQFLDPISLAIH
jgi:streptogramin lyase